MPDDYKFVKLEGEKFGYKILGNSLQVDKDTNTVKFTRVHKNGDLEEFDLIPLSKVERVSSGRPGNSLIEEES